MHDAIIEMPGPARTPSISAILPVSNEAAVIGRSVWDMVRVPG